MSTIPALVAWAAGKKILASKLNAIHDAVNYGLGIGSNRRPYASVYRNGAVSVATSTFTLVAFDTEIDDSEAMHDNVTNPSRVICQTDGLFRVTYGYGFATAGGGTGRRLAQVRRNAAGSSAGGTLDQQINISSTPSGSHTAQGTYDARFTTGEYIELFVEQQSGAAINLQTGPGFNFLSMQWQQA